MNTIQRTERLFDIDSHQYEFDANIILCEATDDGRFAVVLDKTAFFPEGGGQFADEGYIDGIKVEDVTEKDGIIYHLLSFPLAQGSAVHGKVNGEVRFRRMQNHSGEHIVSGLIHKHFGYNNVGFHLGHEDVTLDLDGYLDRDALNRIEDEANRAIAENRPINAYYPSPAELSSISYRSKLDLTEGVRLVEIEGYDVCACCAPHVNRTGEIGIIKLLDAIKYKGGTRIHMLCGFDALEDYRARYEAVSSIAAALSVKQSALLDGFSRLQEELDSKKAEIALLNRRINDMTVDALPEDSRNICIFTDTTDALNMRHLLNKAALKCQYLCGIFAGNDTDGYTFVIGRGSTSPDLKALAKDINSAISARGGGSSEMLQGRSSADRATIKAFFDNR